MVGKGCEVVANWRNTGLRGIAAFGEVAVEIDVHRVLIVRAWQRIRIGDMGRRSCRNAIAVGPENGVAAAQHDVVSPRTAHERLMKVVAHGVLIGEALENRSVSGLDVVEGHGVATAVVIDLIGNGKAEWIN